MELRITPEYITTLAEDEIFVFGSNLQGRHGGGAARMAHQNFGAEWGVRSEERRVGKECP